MDFINFGNNTSQPNKNAWQPQKIILKIWILFITTSLDIIVCNMFQKQLIRITIAIHYSCSVYINIYICYYKKWLHIITTKALQFKIYLPVQCTCINLCMLYNIINIFSGIFFIKTWQSSRTKEHTRWTLSSFSV